MTDYVYQRDDAGQWWRMEYMSMWLLKKPFDFRGIGEKVTLTEDQECRFAVLELAERGTEIEKVRTIMVEQAILTFNMQGEP